MSEVKHTPGPWTWGDDFHGLYGSGKDNAVLSHASFEGMWLSYEGDREANARLIASSPDLFEQLSALVALCERQADFNDDGDGGTLERCRSTLAKVTGAAA